MFHMTNRIKHLFLFIFAQFLQHNTLVLRGRREVTSTIQIHPSDPGIVCCNLILVTVHKVQYLGFCILHNF